MGKLLELTSENFEAEVLKSDVPVMVDFWAAWCAPCRAIAPIVEELADTYAGRMKVAKMDVDTHQQVAMQYKIISIPNVLFFKGGEVVDQMIGAYPKREFVGKIDKLVGTAV